MYDPGNCKNSVGLKPNAELRKDAKASSKPKTYYQLIVCLFGLDHHFGHNVGANLMFALEQLFANVFSSRANIRFAPTLGSPQRSHLAETMIKAVYFNIDERHCITNSAPMLPEGALASFLNLALGFSPTLFLQLPRSYIFI